MLTEHLPNTEGKYKFVTFQLPKEDLDKLDQYAKSRRSTRSAILRESVLEKIGVTEP